MIKDHGMRDYRWQSWLINEGPRWVYCPRYRYYYSWKLIYVHSQTQWQSLCVTLHQVKCKLMTLIMLHINATYCNVAGPHPHRMWVFTRMRVCTLALRQPVACDCQGDTRGTPRVQFTNISKMVLCQGLPHCLRLRGVDPCMARHAQSLKSTCLTAKFGSFLDHAETGEKGQNVISSSVQHPISLIFAIHVSFITPLPMIWILLTKPRPYMQKSVPTVCLHCSFAKLKNKHT